jgi:phage terminase large subunit-like protein
LRKKKRKEGKKYWRNRNKRKLLKLKEELDLNNLKIKEKIEDKKDGKRNNLDNLNKM